MALQRGRTTAKTTFVVECTVQQQRDPACTTCETIDWHFGRAEIEVELPRACTARKVRLTNR